MTHLFESSQRHQDFILFLQVFLENHFLDFTCRELELWELLTYIVWHVYWNFEIYPKNSLFSVLCTMLCILKSHQNINKLAKMYGWTAETSNNKQEKKNILWNEQKFTENKNKRHRRFGLWHTNKHLYHPFPHKPNLIHIKWWINLFPTRTRLLCDTDS